MRYEISVAVSAGVERLKPLGVSRTIRGGDCVLSREGWIANDGIEPWIVAIEHLWELEVPMERRDRVLAPSKRCGN